MGLLVLLELGVVVLGAVLFWDAVQQTSLRDALVGRLTRRRERTLAAEAEQWLAGGDDQH